MSHTKIIIVLSFVSFSIASLAEKSPESPSDRGEAKPIVSVKISEPKPQPKPNEVTGTSRPFSSLSVGEEKPTSITGKFTFPCEVQDDKKKSYNDVLILDEEKGIVQWVRYFFTDLECKTNDVKVVWDGTIETKIRNQSYNLNFHKLNGIPVVYSLSITHKNEVITIGQSPSEGRRTN